MAVLYRSMGNPAGGFRGTAHHAPWQAHTRFRREILKAAIRKRTKQGKTAAAYRLEQVCRHRRSGPERQLGLGVLPAFSSQEFQFERPHSPSQEVNRTWKFQFKASCF